MSGGAADVAGSGSNGPDGQRREQVAPLDVRLAGAALGAWLGCQFGFLLRPSSWIAALWCGPAVAVLAALLAWRTRRSRVRVAAIGLLAVLVGAGAAVLRILPLTAAPIGELVREGAAFRAEVVLRTDPVVRSGAVVGDRRAPDTTEATADLLSLTARGTAYRLRVPVLVRGGSDLVGLPPGTRLVVAGVLRSPGPRMGVAAILSLRDRAQVTARAGPVWRATTALRFGLVRASSGLPTDVRGLLPGLVVGDTTAASPELQADMRTTGLTHLVAVSGTNTALVLAALLALTRVLRVRRLARAGVALLGLAGFVVLVRPQASVSRAAVMGVVAVLALTAGGRRRALPALSAAVLVLVIVDPWLAVTYGFALSVCATAGLVLLAPHVSRMLHGRLARAPAALLDAVAVSLAAQVATAPLIAALAGYLSLVSLPANLLAAPAVGPATVLGVLATLAAPVAPWLAWLLVRAAAIPCAWIALVAHLLARPGWATISWPVGLAGALALIVAGLGGWMGFRLLNPRRRWRVALVLVLAAVLGRVAAGRVASSGWPPAGWVVVMCDVGQGDALVLADGPGRAVVVDTGPLPEPVDHCLSRLHVREVTTLVLTHFHADHVGGLGGVLHRRRVDQVLTSPYPDPLGEALLVRARLLVARVPERSLSAGQVLSATQLSAKVLWPPAPNTPGSALTTAGPNDESVVLSVTCAAARPIHVLLTADVGEVPQAAIESAGGIPSKVDVVKVPHHGSAYQAAGFAGRVAGAVALVSVGAGNPYGHPAAVTMVRFGAASGVVLRTDRSGDVAVVATAAGQLEYATSR